MAYRITVTEVSPGPDTGEKIEKEVFRQTVETLDMAGLILSLNKQKRIRRSRYATAPKQP